MVKNKELVSTFDKKVVFVGEKGTGVTSLIACYVQKTMPCYHSDPICKKSQEITIDLGKSKVNLEICDLGQKTWHERVIDYTETNVFVICCSVEYPASLLRAYQHWICEIRSYCPYTPVFLVCNKIDLRDDKGVTEKLQQYGLKLISKFAGEVMSETIKAAGYFETSTLHNFNIDELFKRIAIASLKEKDKSERRCCCNVL
ncbi:rho-related protein racC-like [Hydractinia symbiolongicarpus]|uniref:rho-related protein racC-like n=1 Tax=Hydractinia symbiolongicarpus TaxID=13093 RepID=UPI00254F5517|nr:rho-related protein racC-like [Hydractinia symbiolongicarpus]